MNKNSTFLRIMLAIAVALTAALPSFAAVSDSVPAPPTGKIYVAQNGDPYVTCVLNVPTLDAAGRPVATVTAIKVYRAGKLVHSVNPGNATFVTIIDTVAQNNKKYTYGFSAANKYGESSQIRGEVFVGFDKPAVPPAAYSRLSADRKTMHMWWEPPTVDAPGKPIDPSKLKYQVRVRDANNKYKVLEKSFSGLSYDFVYNDTATQLYYPSIAAINEQGTGLSRGGEGQFMGNASKMPFRESWVNGRFKIPMLFLTEEGGFTFGVIRDVSAPGMPASDGDNGAYRIRATVPPGIGRLVTNYIDIENSGNPVYAINACQISKYPGAGKIELIASCDSVETTLATFNLDSMGYNKWFTLSCSLQKFKGKRIQMIARSTSSHMAFLFYDNVRIFDASAPDASILNPQYPDFMLPGRPYEFQVAASNLSVNKITDAAIEVYRNGVKAASHPVTLEPLSTQTLTIKETIPVNTTDSVFKYTMKLNLEGDVDLKNNSTAEVSVPILHDAPMPEVQRLLSLSSSRLDLTWEAPDMSKVPADRVTEDFESYQANTPNFGKWTSVDRDKRPNINFTNNNIQLFDTKPAGFLVLDRTPWINELSFEAHVDGIKMAASLTTNDDLPADDWLISPELNGAAQTVSFWASAYFKYKLPFEVWYSTKSKNLDDFVRIDSTMFNVQWKRFDYNLPQGAKYFAIRAIHTFKYAGDGNSPLMLVDDASFTPAGTGQANLLGYNIYCDGEKLNATPIEQKEYKGTLMPGTHDYQVTALYDRGESKPVTVSITAGVENYLDNATKVEGLKGAISITTSANASVNVYSLQGTHVLSVNAAPGTTLLNLPAGIYIVNVAGKTHKLTVR